MRVIIAGSRNITDRAVVERAIADSGFQITEVVEGGQRTYDKSGRIIGGVDWWARRHALDNDLPCRTIAALWELYGKSAGPRRNRLMAEYGEALIAIPQGVSKGTRDMIAAARERGIQVYVAKVAG